MNLPPKRERPRSNIPRGPKRSWQKHERWVRSHSCAIPGCANTQTEFAHLRNAANSGMGLKPHSSFGVPLCAAHHSQAHSVGHDTLARLYKIDLWALAEEFVKRSPDLAMKEAMQAEMRDFIDD